MKREFSILIYCPVPREITQLFDTDITVFRKAFQNIYDLLTTEGECFLTLFAYTQMYHFYVILKHSEKWRDWLQDMTTFLSPYYNISVRTLFLFKVFMIYLSLRAGGRSTFTDLITR